ncbi:histidine--tRNA ligase [Candidatus Mycoplasma haematohominis]|uniref:Histidine--tRNA ligase n=1 Tax=Candidatus Mycoplasma haematohominis TaxID=1494318 RepID=A0A478FQT1_9MOLU|nr:histidine--tRNA ligase [Candidatus Mycoplasma haemohominis]
MPTVIQKPRGTKDLYGVDLKRTQELCSIIRDMFISYGYSEIRTPIFEFMEVFEYNDEALLAANKEFFQIKSRDSDGEVAEDRAGFVLRPENTASVARALIENKIMNKQVDYELRYFYEGPYFRYERPQNGRQRQFTQMGIEKINAHSIHDDLENIVIVHAIQERLGIQLCLKINYLGNEKTKKIWNNALQEYFEEYRDQLTPISQKRINENPMRILDDKIDCQKDFVKNAPKIETFLTKEEMRNMEKIKELISTLKIHSIHDPCLVRGIDYYTGLIYEWIDEKTGLTIIAGGRYDHLFERFGEQKTPALGLAIGIERLKALLEREDYQWQNDQSYYLYLYPQEELTPEYYKWVYEWRKLISQQSYKVYCIASYEILSPEKHQKIAKKQSQNEKVYMIEGNGYNYTNADIEAQFKKFIEYMKDN